MKKYLLAALLGLGLCASPALSQTPVPPQPPVPAADGTAVVGLELPPDQNVAFDEGFVTVQAKCKGEVKWLVISTNKVKYVTVAQTNSIIISVPPQGGVINVFAVGNVDGKMTEFARTNINIGNAPGPNPGPVNPPNPNPNPPAPVVTKLHLTFLVDMNNTTPEMAKLLNSESLRKGINQKGHWFRLYDIKSDIVAQKKLDGVVQRVGGNNVLIVQGDDGRVLSATTIPATEQEVLAIIQKITGK